MKLLILSPIAYAFWEAPTYSLLAIVALLFIVQVIGELMKSKTPTNQSYEEIKELFNEDAEGISCSATPDDIVSKDIYSDEEEKESNYIDIKCNIPDFTLFTYRDLQKIAKSLEIKKVNRKRLILEDELKHLLLDKEVIDLFH